MYEFYALIKTDEHMLYPSEIAEMFGIYSSTCKPHSTLIKQIVLDYLKESNIPYQAIYFNSRHGLKEVFSREHYAPALERFKLIADENKYRSINNRSYYFKIYKTKEN